MLVKFRDWCNLHAPFLFRETMPVWLTILASAFAGFAAAVGTYYIAPAVNRQYQIDEARSQHVTKTTQALNDEIIALSKKVRRLNEALVNGSKGASSIRGDCLDLVTKLQWMLVDLRVVLKSDADREAVSRLGKAIAAVKIALDRSVDARAQPQLLDAMRALGEQTRDVLGRRLISAQPQPH